MNKEKLLKSFETYLDLGIDSKEFNFSQFATKKQASEFVESHFSIRSNFTDIAELNHLREKAISVDLFEKSNGQTLQGKKINKIKNK